MDESEMFGARVRRLREEKGYGLREFARMIGVSATYMSKIERDEYPPPAEERILAIAGALDQNPDELLALANRVASDLTDIIKRQPREMASFLRAANGLTPDAVARLAKMAQKAREK